MSQVATNGAVTLKEAVDLICTNPRNTFHLVGTPGIGKTAMHKVIAERLNMKPIYMDVPNLEIGDIGIPMPNHQTRTTQFYPNEFWGFHLDEPLCIFLDEFTKGENGVKNTLHPVLTHPRRIGGLTIHPDSVVITAGNFSGDGVGDVMKAHSRNRLTELPIKNPTTQEWIDDWAVHNDIVPEVMAWARETPQIFQSYKDAAQADNHYNYNPKRPQAAFCSPRSVAGASTIVRNRDKYTTNALITALEGTIGYSGARDMVAYIQMADELTPWAEVIANPSTAPVPKHVSALCIMAFGAVMRIDNKNIGKWFEYLKRCPKELQSIFCLTASKNPQKKDVLFSSSAFVTWARDNAYLF
jgi:hypothetical protein